MRPSARVAWAAAAVIAVDASLVALFSVVRGDFSETDGRIVVTLALALFAGGSAFSGLAVVDRDQPLGWGLVAGAAVAFVVAVPAVWSLFSEFDDTDSKVALGASAALLAGLLWATAWLMARGVAALHLSRATAVLAFFAAVFSIVALAFDTRVDEWGELLAALWILAVLTYVLTPLVTRLTAAPATAGRVLATLDGVELVVTTAGGLEPDLRPGERLALRRRA